MTLHQETAGVQTSSSRLLFKKSPKPKKRLIQRPNWFYSRRHEEKKVKKPRTDFLVLLICWKESPRKGQKDMKLSMVKMQFIRLFVKHSALTEIHWKGWLCLLVLDLKIHLIMIDEYLHAHPSMVLLCAQPVFWGKSQGRLPSSWLPRKMRNDVAMLLVVKQNLNDLQDVSQQADGIPKMLLE